MECLRQSGASVIVCLVCCVLAAVRSPALQPTNGEMGIKFVNVAEQAGIKHKTIYGDEHKNRYLLETTGCGVAFIDFDNDGWQDVFLVNGTRQTSCHPSLSKSIKATPHPVVTR